ncbi:uncharacterized protein LOC109716676 [Ananas comosus]|uniref:Uncharacterized protein LOC109716676 n=1 Tax=Ananas comosus TaxID=4615 RepID=A0A6P5FXU2_ANACO|nr:uncharacterized protein LOC109716676 [Ananas comosus]
MDQRKVRAISKCETPTTVSELWPFLGLVNYYRRFIVDFPARAIPLTDLLKKNYSWVWTSQCAEAFKDLKRAETKNSVLLLSNCSHTFEVHTDASDFPIGGVLVQNGHPITYASSTTPSGVTPSRRRNDRCGALLANLAVLFAWEQVGDLGSILMVVDHFFKYETFIAAPTNCTAEEAAHLFISHIVKLWGVPTSMMSDRNPRFTGKFWNEVFKILGSELLFSISFRPQTNGQIERVNALLEEYLRHYVSAN